MAESVFDGLSTRRVDRETRVWFLLAQPSELVAGARGETSTPTTLGEADVFADEEQARDALDVHYAWCAARVDSHVLLSTRWFLQSALVGPSVTPALGDVFVASTDVLDEEQHGHGDVWAAAGGFLTQGEVIHWSPFIRAVRPLISATGDAPLTLAHRDDESVYFHRVWFAPLHSVRVYPSEIVVGETD